MVEQTSSALDKREKKVVWGFRIEPDLAEKIEKFSEKHNCDRTEALHGVFREGEETVRLQTLTIRELREQLEVFKKYTGGQIVAQQPVKSFNPPSTPSSSLVQCDFAGKNHNEKLMLRKEICTACQLSYDAAVPCPKKKPAGTPPPTVRDVNLALGIECRALGEKKDAES